MPCHAASRRTLCRRTRRVWDATRRCKRDDARRHATCTPGTQPQRGLHCSAARGCCPGSQRSYVAFATLLPRVATPFPAVQHDPAVQRSGAGAAYALLSSASASAACTDDVSNPTTFSAAQGVATCSVATRRAPLQRILADATCSYGLGAPIRIACGGPSISRSTLSRWRKLHTHTPIRNNMHTYAHA